MRIRGRLIYMIYANPCVCGNHAINRKSFLMETTLEDIQSNSGDDLAGYSTHSFGWIQHTILLQFNFSGNVRVCENKGGMISCSSGTVIYVVSSNYGRTSRRFCIAGIHSRYLRNLNCRERTTLAKVKRSCDRKSYCSLYAANSVYGDTCYGTYKYLDLHYICYS
jgi:hypothetical protein